MSIRALLARAAVSKPLSATPRWWLGVVLAGTSPFAVLADRLFIRYTSLLELGARKGEVGAQKGDVAVAGA
jgi:hypothetical protein